MLEQQVLEAINILAPMVWSGIFKLAIAIIIALVIKKFIENISSYIMFFINKDISKNVAIRINGKEGYIEDYNFRFITIKTLDGFKQYIPISRWIFQTWEIKEFNGKDKWLDWIST